MTPTEAYLPIIAAELGFCILFFVVFMCLEVFNGMYVRKQYAEAAKQERERQANPLAFLNLPGMVQANQAGTAADKPAATACIKDADGNCKDCTGECKKDGHGNYIKEGGNYL